MLPIEDIKIWVIALISFKTHTENNQSQVKQDIVIDNASLKMGAV